MANQRVFFLPFIFSIITIGFKPNTDIEKKYNEVYDNYIKGEITAEQYLDEADSSDPDYRLKTIVLYNPTENTKCSYLGDGCIKTYVIDKNNLVSDTSVTLLPVIDDYNSPITYTEFLTQKESIKTKYKTSTKALQVEDILPVVSKDINDNKP